MHKKAAIYHYTDVSKQRPKIYRNQLEALKDYAESVGLHVVDIYCDMSIKRCERVAFDRFLVNAAQYDALVTKDYYHIAANTGQCLGVMQQLRDNGLQIYTIENGIFTWGDAPYDKPLQVATYTRHCGVTTKKDVITLSNDILKLFIAKKTNWTLIDQYCDANLRQKDSAQDNMKTLIANRNKYDLLLVHNLHDVHWRTSNFCRIREQLQIDIYSLEEGFLQYRDL